MYTLQRGQKALLEKVSLVDERLYTRTHTHTPAQLTLLSFLITHLYLTFSAHPVL